METSQPRLLSLDALRGLDMLFIIGLDALLRTWASLYAPEEVRSEVWRQLGHCSWEGLALYDLIFPLFVFISGAAMYFSLTRAQARGMNRWSLLAKLWKRAFILAICGCLVSTWDIHELFLLSPGFASIRYASVLGLIGISCALAGSAILILRRSWSAPVLALVVLATVWCLQHFGGDMTPSGCFNAKVDQALLPGVLHSGSYDPEGPLCILSATALALLGFCAGRTCSSSFSLGRQLALLVVVGLACVGVGQVSGPVVKGIWTPAFVWTTGGIGFILLALFRLLCDVGRWGAWVSFPFRVVGLNALFIYLLTHLPGYPQLCNHLSSFLVHRADIAPALEPLCASSLSLAGAWSICFLLWRAGILIKI